MPHLSLHKAKDPEAYLKGKNNIAVLPNSSFSFYSQKEDSYFDVYVHSVRLDGMSVVSIKSKGEKFEIPTKLLEEPLNPSVNQRFKYYEKIVELVLSKKAKSMICSGQGGIGKSHVVKNIIERDELEEGVDFIMMKGHCSPFALFDTLRANPDKTFIFDDCDSVLHEPTSGNILKSVLDTYERRRVTWMSKANSGEKTFEFTGSAVFLSNLDKNKLSQALISRSILIDLHMTNEEKIDRMRYLLPTLDVGRNLTAEQKLEVLAMLDKYKNTVFDFNLRTLIKGLIAYEATEDIDLVKYQILNG